MQLRNGALIQSITRQIVPIVLLVPTVAILLAGFKRPTAPVGPNGSHRSPFKRTIRESLTTR
jgi:hypothetical protein